MELAILLSTLTSTMMEVQGKYSYVIKIITVTGLAIGYP